MTERYGHHGKKGCCYKCTKRTVGCSINCPDRQEEKQNEIAEKIAKKKYLHPAGVSYFRKPEYIPSGAKQSKKRYR